MKKYTVPAALLLTAVLAAGCGQAAAPEAVETAATESAETVQETTDGEKAAESVESVPAVIDNPCLRAANEYFTEWAGENMQAAEGLIPVSSIVKVDDSDKSDVKLYGIHELNTYSVDGSVLKIADTKKLTGVMHMAEDGGTFKVTGAEWAEEGSSVKSALQKIVTDEAMYQDMAEGSISPALRTWTIGQAAKALGLSADSYQPKDGVKISLAQETKKAEDWVSKLAEGIQGDQFVTVGKSAGSSAVLMLHEKASNGGWNTLLNAPALIGKGGLSEDGAAGTTKIGLSELSVDDLQAIGTELSTSGGIAVPKDILDALKKGVKPGCSLVVDTEENIENGTAVKAPKSTLAAAMEKVSYGEKLTAEERTAIADGLEEALAANSLGDVARYACSYTASFGTAVRNGDSGYLALSADTFPTEIRSSRGTIPFTIGRMRQDDAGNGGQVPETLQFTTADGTVVDAYTLWTNDFCIGELTQTDGVYGIFEGSDGRYTLERLGDAAETVPAESTAAQETAAAGNPKGPADDALVNDVNQETAAQTQAQETTAAAAAEAKVSLPAYRYTGAGDQAIMQAVAGYMNGIGKQYEASDVSIPNLQIAGVDAANPDDVKVYGDFWVMNYNLTGRTLESQSGGSYPGVMHLKKAGSGYTVTDFEVADDGSGFQESLERICADHPEYASMLVNSEFDEDLRTETIRQYVKANGLDIEFYKDYGWDPVEID